MGIPAADSGSPPERCRRGLAGHRGDAHKALVGAQAVLQMIDAENWTLAAVAGGKLQPLSGQGSTFAAGPNTVSTPTW